MRTRLAILLLMALPVSAAAWGQKGHLMVNRLAIETAAPDLPPFMGAAAETITYNGFEPDRWREETDSPMSIAQAPDHFLDSEYWGDIMTLEPNRYAFMAKLQEKKLD